MNQEQELRAIHDALDILLASIIADRALKPRRPKLELDGKELAGILPETRAHGMTLDLLENPREGAFTIAIKALGERLHEIDGMRAMGAALEAMEDRDPEHAERRCSILDHRWSGIGNWMS